MAFQWITRDLQVHRKMPFGYTDWGCSEGTCCCTGSGSGTTGLKNEPAGISHSQSRPPDVGQWDTCQRRWKRPGITTQVSLISIAQHKLWYTLVLDEIFPRWVIGVWWLGGVAVLQNNHKAMIWLLQRDPDIQRGAHWQRDQARWINLTVIRGTVQEHGGFCSDTHAWNAIFQPVKETYFRFYITVIMNITAVTSLCFSTRFLLQKTVTHLTLSYTHSLQEGFDGYVQAGVCLQGICTAKCKTLRDSEGCIACKIDKYSVWEDDVRAVGLKESGQKLRYPVKCWHEYFTLMDRSLPSVCSHRHLLWPPLHTKLCCFALWSWSSLWLLGDQRMDPNQKMPKQPRKNLFQYYYGRRQAEVARLKRKTRKWSCESHDKRTFGYKLKDNLKQHLNIKGNSRSQTTLASSWWPQLWMPNPRCLHCVIDASSPLQLTSSSQMGPLPRPKAAFCGAEVATPHSSCLQTTLASLRSHRSSHTVPHCPLWWISTLPEQRWPELTSLTGAWADRKQGGANIYRNAQDHLQRHSRVSAISVKRGMV